MLFEAVEAVSALAIVEREASIHLLFTDLGLPGAMDGRALAERVRSGGTRGLVGVGAARLGE